jgi:hypothetical protein
MIIQNAMNPACAPNVVVAINSPEPTIEAERINPGPRNFNLPLNVTGGSLIVLSVITYRSWGINYGDSIDILNKYNQLSSF